MRLGVVVMVAVLAGSLAGCGAACSCVAPDVVDPPATVTPGETVTLDLANLYATCCDTGRMPWQDPDAALESVRVTFTLVPQGVFDEQTIDVADDATATVTLDVPRDATDFVYVQINGVEYERIPVDG